MKGHAHKKSQPAKDRESGYNLRERKDTRKKLAKMGAKLEDDKVTLISTEDISFTTHKMFRPEEGDGLFEESLSISEGDSDEVMLLTDEFARQKKAADEKSLTILSQVLIPFLVAGIGMVSAGIVLDSVQHWDVFVTVNELFIMVPGLLGLKGNLEMTLASRLSTRANLGQMDSRKSCISLIIGNLALIQCQALVVGFLASVVAAVIGCIQEGNFNFANIVLLCASAMVTASFASFLLGLVMVGVILLSRYINVNPDNVATPIAGALGDLVTLSLLAAISSIIYQVKNAYFAPIIIVVFMLFMPFWIWLARKDSSTKEVLRTGWTPVILAMLISSVGGIILDNTVTTYKGIAVYQPVINGIGGNLVAVQASRISTWLHQKSNMGQLPEGSEKICASPFSVFFAKDNHPRTARVLLLLVVPGHLLFAYLISIFKAGHTSLTPIFICVYLVAAMLQVIILLYVAQVLIFWMWNNNIDPDNSAIPYLTALGDLLGTGFLAIAFHILFLVGDRDSDLGD